jgi:AbiV family abortive infection protein
MKITPEILREGILKNLRNSQELCDESRILIDYKKFARAHTLAHLAREEFSKCFILYRALINLILGVEIDWKKTRKRYSNHQDKIMNDRILSYHIVENVKNEYDKNFKPNDFLKGIDETNNQKNSGLYVNWTNENVFNMPSDLFSEEKAIRNLEIAEYRIALFSKVFIDISDFSEENIASIKKKISLNSVEETINEIYKKFNE